MNKATTTQTNRLFSPLSLTGKRITVMGLGRFGGGAAAARYAADQGARVTITDLANEESLRPILDELADVPFGRIRLGTHVPEDFQTADVVIVNPAVPPESPFLQIARDAGARLTSEIELFLDACPCRVIAVTGTNGKSTTAAMTAHVLTGCGKIAWLGGNIGHSLLADLDKITPDDWAVVEISSFQLEGLGPERPYFSAVAVTNFTPNHLERHCTLQAYATAKRRAFDFLPADATVVMDSEDSMLRRWIHPTEDANPRVVRPIDPRNLPPLAVPGPHNRPTPRPR